MTASAYQQQPYGGMVPPPVNTIVNPAMNPQIMPTMNIPQVSRDPPPYELLVSESSTGVSNNDVYGKQPPHNPNFPLM